MDKLKDELKTLEVELNEYYQIEREESLKYQEMSEKIKDSIKAHNEILLERNKLKEDLDSGLKEFKELVDYVTDYKEKQATLLKRQYEIVIINIITEINEIKFDYQPDIFKKFDRLRSINTSKFPLLNRKIEKFSETLKFDLKKSIYQGIEDTEIENKLYAFGFLVLYEDHFEESVFVPFLLRKIQIKFDFHFRSERETNRLDKPEWMFNFLQKELDKGYELYEIYLEASERRLFEFTEFIDEVMNNVDKKIKELISSDSIQKRALLLHFAEEYHRFGEVLHEKYKYSIRIDEISKAVTEIELETIRRELEAIHKLNYVQWIRSYQKLITEIFVFVTTYRFVNVNVTIEDCIGMINVFIKKYIDDFRFINRLEIKQTGFLYTEIEKLKQYIVKEETEMKLNYKDLPHDMLGNSLEILSELNSHILVLLITLAENDVEKVLNKLYHFNYISQESKRVFIVELSRCLDDYKNCSGFSIISENMAKKIDSYVFNEIIMSIVFTTSEFLEFKEFYMELKALFRDPVSSYQWTSDDGCKTLVAIFEGTKLRGQLYKKLKGNYDKGQS